VNNLSLAYEERGEGRPLLFIHGYPFNKRLWQPQLDGLQDAARLLAPDLRGHGESQAVSGPYWMDTLAGDLQAFLDAVHATRPTVICGLSMGGYVAMAFYRQYGPHAAGLILAATRAGADSASGREQRDEAAHLAQEEGVPAIVESMLPKLLSPKTYDRSPDLVEYVRQMMLGTSLDGILGDLMGMKERPASWTTLEVIDLPVLILQGADDQIISYDEAQAMHEALANSQLEVIPDAGHLLNLEQPERFNQAVRRFVQSLPA
jgi:pimeloyl-ACP methyl ester carboxylesterase